MRCRTRIRSSEGPGAGRPCSGGDLVSCIMPTADRRPFIKGAINCFFAQTYPEKELIIIDDGGDGIRDLVPGDPRVRYIRLEKRLSIGEKRNLACEAAQGRIIAHFDDDDWSAPWRLSCQVSCLETTGAELCGLACLLFFDVQQCRAWQYRCPPGQPPWVAGGTMAYLKGFWQRHRFEHTSQGEDTGFIWQNPRPRLHVLEDNRFFVGGIHPENTSTKRTGSDRWTRVAVSEVVRIVSGGWPGTSGRKAAVRLQTPEKQPSLQPDSRPLVAVSIPFFGCRSLLLRAVQSILSQTWENLILVVVNDGDRPPWQSLAHIEDPRLVRFDLGRNHGRYFADAVVLNAVDAEYFLVQDADDWSEPERVAALVKKILKTGADGAVSPNWVWRDKGSLRELERPRDMDRPPGPQLEHRFHHIGLFRRRHLLSIGGYYGGFRIGYDTLLTALMSLTGRIACTDHPLYHRTIRGDSLTGAKATGMGSACRARTRKDLQNLYTRAFSFYRSWRSGRMDQKTLCQRIKKMVLDQIPEDEALAMDRACRDLKKILLSQKPYPGSSVKPMKVPRPKASGWVNQDLSRLGVALFCRGGLSRLEQTLSSLAGGYPDLFQQARLKILAPGGQGQAACDLSGTGYFDRIISPAWPALSTGQAVSLLVEEILRPGGLAAILYLDDGWTWNGRDRQWLDKGLFILKDCSYVGQVQLGGRNGVAPSCPLPVAKAVSGQRRHFGFYRAGSARFTFTPFLIRAADASRIFPCASRARAREKFLATGMTTVRLDPDSFCHSERDRERDVTPQPFVRGGYDARFHSKENHALACAAFCRGHDHDIRCLYGRVQTGRDCRHIHRNPGLESRCL